MKIKVLIIGFGSIGNRHAEVFKDLGSDVAVVSQRVHQNNDYIFFSSLENALDSFAPQHIVVCNKTSEHYESIKEISRLGYKGTVLCEKPLFHRKFPIEDFKDLNIKIAYNLRFHPGIAFLKKSLMNTKEKLLIADTYCGQYLPEWRPGKNYEESYSASRDLGGGVLRDLSHELDYMHYLLGPLNISYSKVDKISNLKINSEDFVSISGSSELCENMTIHLNYLDRNAERSLRIITNENTYKLDMVNFKLWINKKEVKLERLDTYKEQALCILKDISNPQLCSLEDGKYIINLIESVENKKAEK